MNPFTHKLDTSLRVATLGKGRVPAPKGKFSREVLTKVITDYIYAYLETAMKLGQPVPTMMFVLHDNKAENPSPLVVPYTLNEYDLEALEGFTALLLEQYPIKDYSLEMVLYARFEADFRKKGEFNVMFGARDIGGASLHTSYRYTRYKAYEELTHQNGDRPYFDRWIQKSKIKDDFLNGALAQYFTLITMKVRKTYAQ